MRLAGTFSSEDESESLLETFLVTFFVFFFVSSMLYLRDESALAFFVFAVLVLVDGIWIFCSVFN